MSFRPTEHPVLKLPTPQEMAAMDAAALRAFLLKREELIRREKEDPLRYGYEPWTFKLADALLAESRSQAAELIAAARDLPAEIRLQVNANLDAIWGHTAILVMGQNRSGKTIWATKRQVRRTVQTKDGAFVFFEASEKASINKQQSKVHAYLPPEWRSVGKQGDTTYVKYTKQNGFSGAQFTLPSGTQGFFFNYKQDVGVFEGYELDGVWFDELVPLPFLEALEFRVGQDRRMEEIVTFTPVLGYTPTVGRYIAGATTIATHRAELLPQDMVHVKGCLRGHLPLIMQCRRPEACVLFFPWGSNPYGANEEVAAKLKGASLAKIKIRAYGWTDKMVNGAFPKYGPAHRISRRRFQEICGAAVGDKQKAQSGTGGVTRYVACDPGGAKNWFIAWLAVTPGGHVIVYREWPDRKTHGEWAIPPGGQDRTRLFDWRPGPAQRSEAGRGIIGYKKLILELEGWVWDEKAGAWDGSKAERIEARVMDPRMGGMEAPAEDEGTSIIAMLGEEQTDRNGRVVGPEMEWIAAPASRVEETVQMINDLMEYDEEQPINVLNCPKFYVVAEDCEQLDLTLQEFTGAGTDRDALKDPCDVLRYFVKSDLGYLEDGALVSKRGGAY